MNDQEFEDLKDDIARTMAELRSLQKRYRTEVGQDYLGIRQVDEDVTDKVEVGNPDDEFLQIYTCVCGARFDDYEALSIYKDDYWECAECGRGLYFRNNVRVFEVFV
jgi:DNA-directed RNA polymerase subunit RPC12/RpoP